MGKHLGALHHQLPIQQVEPGLEKETEQMALTDPSAAGGTQNLPYSFFLCCSFRFANQLSFLRVVDLGGFFFHSFVVL